MVLQYQQEERRIKMNKYLVKINSEKDIYPEVSGYILGIEGFSICFGKSYTISEVLKFKEEHNDKEIFVSLNRPIFESELGDYRIVLKELDKLNLNGIIVGDIAALTYNLKTNIILDQLHLNNSYLSINHYEKNGVSGIVLTNDITLDDINEIRSNTKCLLFKQVFGYAHISTSKRKLLSNYKKYFNIKNKSSFYQLQEHDDNKYKIIEDYFGCHILTSKKLNLLNYINNINVNYFIIDSFLMEDNIDMVINAFLNRDIDLNEKINEKYDCNSGFINKNTIYKVKNDE